MVTDGTADWERYGRSLHQAMAEVLEDALP